MSIAMATKLQQERTENISKQWCFSHGVEFVLVVKNIQVILNVK